LPVCSGYRTGVRLSWLGGEMKLVAGALFGARHPPSVAARPMAKAIARDYLRGVRIDGFALDDPLPNVAHACRTVTEAVRFALRRARQGF